jgi:hypothetical protein
MNHPEQGGVCAVYAARRARAGDMSIVIIVASIVLALGLVAWET